MPKLNRFQIQERWHDIRHLHEKGQWKAEGGVPEWVYDILRDHYCGHSLGEIGTSSVELAALHEMVESLLEMLDKVRKQLSDTRRLVR